MTEINPEVLVHLLHAPYELARKQCGGWLLQAMTSAHSHILSVGIDLHRSLRLSPPPPKRVALFGDVATAFCPPPTESDPTGHSVKGDTAGVHRFLKTLASGAAFAGICSGLHTFVWKPPKPDAGPESSMLQLTLPFTALPLGIRESLNGGRLQYHQLG